MSRWNWITRTFNSWRRNASGTTLRPSSRTRKSRIGFETLEERAVPAVLDLTTAGAGESANGALFRQYDGQPTGTGVIDSFVRLQAGGSSTVEQGYNTDFRKLQFNENNSRQFTRSIHLSDLPRVNIDGVSYREVSLDINQKASQSLLSLDELRVYVGDTGNLTGYNTTTKQLAGLSPIYDLDAGGDNWVKLDGRLNQGSGKGDMLFYVPEAAFGADAEDKNIYLYSKFGVNLAANAGFEEWAIGPSQSQPPIEDNCGAISGTVTDSLTGLGLAQLTVFIDANGDGLLGLDEVSTQTDSNGNYVFDDLENGTYLITIIPPDDAIEVNPLDYFVTLDEPCEHVIDINFVILFDNPNDS